MFPRTWTSTPTAISIIPAADNVKLALLVEAIILAFTQMFPAWPPPSKALVEMKTLVPLFNKPTMLLFLILELLFTELQ